MDFNYEDEIQEITSDNESEKQRPTPERSEMAKDGITFDVGNGAVEAERELDENEKSNVQTKGIQAYLCQWKSFVISCWGLIDCNRPVEVPRVRLYQIWPGKNVFYFKGRMICGPYQRSLILIMISIIICEWIIFSYNSDVSRRHRVVISAVSVVLSTIVLINLLLAATSDPGIIPRNQGTQLIEKGMRMQSKSCKTRSRRVYINGIEIKVKYCRICEIFRPPRSAHCVVCDNCVNRFDHHCPWIGHCIGLRNYRSYLMFIFSGYVFFLFIVAVSSWRIMMNMEVLNNITLKIIGDMPETFALAIFSLMVVWFLGGLLMFHGYLISLNQTTYERFRRRYVNSTNPFDKGIMENMKEVLFAKLEPSRINFRELVKPEWDSIARTLSYTSQKTRNAEEQTNKQESCSDLNNDPEVQEMEV